jgi:hypothetical protein
LWWAVLVLFFYSHLIEKVVSRVLSLGQVAASFSLRFWENEFSTVQKIKSTFIIIDGVSNPEILWGADNDRLIIISNGFSFFFCFYLIIFSLVYLTVEDLVTHD